MRFESRREVSKFAISSLIAALNVFTYFWLLVFIFDIVIWFTRYFPRNSNNSFWSQNSTSVSILFMFTSKRHINASYTVHAVCRQHINKHSNFMVGQPNPFAPTPAQPKVERTYLPINQTAICEWNFACVVEIPSVSVRKKISFIPN